MPFFKHHLVAALVLAPFALGDDDFSCKTFADIYDSGEDLCNTMFGDAFVATADEKNAFTMWWFDDGNPNDQTTAGLNMTTPKHCNVSYYHKDKPTPESSAFTECHPYKDNACCEEATVTTVDALNEAYGSGYEWDRCGKLSQACERFFVQEACLYECDPNIGNYRKCSDAQVAAASEDDECYYNTWELYKMPIKLGYCNAWYTACYEDKFCGGDSGNFFSCAEYYHPTESTDAAGLPGWAIALITVLGIVVMFAVVMFCITIRREVIGDPLFKPLTSRELEQKVGEPTGL